MGARTGQQDGLRNTMLVDAYYWSQIILTIIAACAVVAGYIQLQTFKRFEILKILEDESTRRARLVVFREIDQLKDAQWWHQHPQLEASAVIVCASYDLAGTVAKGQNRAFFAKYWGYSICESHEILERYLEHRRDKNPSTYPEYSALYRYVRRRHPVR